MIVAPAPVEDAVASISALAELSDAVGKLAMEFGMGQPLASFQTLLKTYQSLAAAEAALCAAVLLFFKTKEA